MLAEFQQLLGLVQCCGDAAILGYMDMARPICEVLCEDSSTQALLAQQLQSVMQLFVRLGRQHVALKLMALHFAGSLTALLKPAARGLWMEESTTALLDFSAVLQQDAELDSILAGSSVLKAHPPWADSLWRQSALREICDLLASRTSKRLAAALPAALPAAYIERGQLHLLLLLDKGSSGTADSDSGIGDCRKRVSLARLLELQKSSLRDCRKHGSTLFNCACTIRHESEADAHRASTPDELEHIRRVWQLYKPVLLQLKQVRRLQPVAMCDHPGVMDTSWI